MFIKLAPSAAHAAQPELAGTTAVVFDVLRATSTIVTALARGYSKVYPAVDVDEALHIAGSRSHVLAGERGGLKITGFPRGNSPLEFVAGPEKDGAELVLTTSNGTGAVRASSTADRVLLGSVLNARAAARAAVAHGQDIYLVCAGSGGGYSLEDALGAGFVLAEMLKSANLAVEMDDRAAAALCLARCYSHDPLAGLMNSAHGKALVRLGREEDLRWCSQLNMFEIAPVYNGEYITA
ncbi:MAG: 2-phosphosulfolactate phosphatase [Firmicutes bacterium]|nr:2-phosphosulfolactate phosphatase [Bacillota bacterium]